MQEEVAVLLVIFNRPEKTKIIIEALRKIKPKYLFVTADGPVKIFPVIMKNAKKARDAINAIDWQWILKQDFWITTSVVEEEYHQVLVGFLKMSIMGLSWKMIASPTHIFFPFVRNCWSVMLMMNG